MDPCATGTCSRLLYLISSNMGLSIMDERIFLDPGDRDESLTFVVDERCHFRVESDDPASNQEYRLLDEKGDTLHFFHFGAIGGDKTFYMSYRLIQGKSPVLSVSERACNLELIGGKGRFIPIRLIPGEVTVLRF